MTRTRSRWWECLEAPIPESTSRIRELNDRLLELNERTGWDIAIHVDAASGGFVAPFAEPELEWDSRLPLVKSINVSGHKYGLVYPGVGWVIWRLKEDLPEELIFHVNYLGGDQPTFNLNFSKGAAQVVGQYYNFLRMGREGYREVMLRLYEVAEQVFSERRSLDGPLRRCWDESRAAIGLLPTEGGKQVHSFRAVGEASGTGLDHSASAPLADAQDIAVVRVVVREGFSRDMADNLLGDLARAVAYLDSVHPAPVKHHHARRKRKTAGVC